MSPPAPARDTHLICPPAQSGLSARVSYTRRRVSTCKWLGDSTKLVNNTAGGGGGGLSLKLGDPHFFLGFGEEKGGGVFF